MSMLKENEEKRSRKEERENQQQQQRLATPSPVCPVDKSVDNRRRANIMHHAWERGITRNDLHAAAEKIGMSAAEVGDWLEYMDDNGWTLRDGVRVNGRNFRRPLRMWHKVQEQIDKREAKRSQNRREHRRKQEEAERLRLLQKEAAKPSSWQLCNERCAFAEVCGCAKKHLIPPQLRSYPIPPQDCDGFEPKEVA
jgi:hypothetical protein